MSRDMKTNMKNICYFNSISEYNGYLESGQTQPCFGGEHSFSTSDPYWIGTKDWQEATDLLINGDKEAAKKINAKIKQLNFDASGYVAKYRMKSDYVGFAPNVPAFMANAPKTMFSIKRIRKPAPVISICYNTGATSGYSADEIATAGATMVEAIRTIEASGVRCNLYTAQLSRCQGHVAGPIVRVKDADQPFDLLKMAYPLGHPSMLRRQKFRFIEITEGIPTCYAGGYGSSVKDDTDLRKVKLVGRHFDAVLTFYDVHQTSVEQTIQLIKSQLKNQLIK